MRRLVEGSWAVAEAVRLCRPQVIAAYPITPQTHIVEHLAQMIADDKLVANFINTESEYASASAVLGAVASGSRAYTASASQGLLLMTEIIFNIAGMRLPVVMTCTNRAISAPINILCDHQDSMALRDAGWIQLYVESNQEAVDTMIQAYRLAEQCELPVMVCMDGFLLTHTYEPVVLPQQNDVDEFLPSFEFSRSLNQQKAITLGGGGEADNYMEFRHELNAALMSAQEMIEDIDRQFSKQFSRSYGGLVDCYRTDDADWVLVTMGSIMGGVRDTVDALREEGELVGAMRIRSYRPFPAVRIIDALSGVKRIAVLERAFSPGAGGILANELRSALLQGGNHVPVDSFIGGLGGREIRANHITELYRASHEADNTIGCRFIGVKPDPSVMEASHG